MTNFIPVYKPTLSGNESKYVNECLNSGWISSKGEFVTRFENAFANYIGASQATSVCNGTVALHLALLALGIGKDDEVIVPTLTYIASVNAVSYVGAKPVFVDSGIDNWNIDVSLIESKISSNTRAILVTHLYGAACDMHSLQTICSKYKLLLIEDVAEAFGSQYQGKFTGTFGDISTFSFFGNKTITTGEGGMVVSKNTELNARVKHLKNQAMSPTQEYWHDEVGFNYRMTNICAAIGLAQLEKADTIIKSKQDIAICYKEKLSGLPLEFQNENPGTKHTYWMVSILLDSKANRDGLREKLKIAGVETRPLFYPAHIMPTYHDIKSYPVAEDLSGRGMNLPSFHSLTEENIGYICDKIREILKSI